MKRRDRRKLFINFEFTPDVLCFTPAIALTKELAGRSIQFYFLCFRLSLIVLENC